MALNFSALSMSLFVRWPTSSSNRTTFSLFLFLLLTCLKNVFTFPPHYWLAPSLIEDHIWCSNSKRSQLSQAGFLSSLLDFWHFGIVCSYVLNRLLLKKWLMLMDPTTFKNKCRFVANTVGVNDLLSTIYTLLEAFLHIFSFLIWGTEITLAVGENNSTEFYPGLCTLMGTKKYNKWKGAIDMVLKAHCFSKPVYYFRSAHRHVLV